eukprot:Phypoly_transcript_05102.p1 GENE.Phypoly_transcript_05102~~Phypoly_transcript_05102.p1  ORF type:complete len:170 (+),score=22.80 Phypoly_transcript_05102:502-1011(+)
MALEVDHNSLTKVPPSLGKCTKLASLSLHDNNIHTLPKELGKLHCKITLDGNPLEDPLMGIYYLGSKALFDYLSQNATDLSSPLLPTISTMYDFEVSIKDLTFLEVLGHGAFGWVYKAVWDIGKGKLASDNIETIAFLHTSLSSISKDNSPHNNKSNDSNNDIQKTTMT